MKRKQKAVPTMPETYFLDAMFGIWLDRLRGSGSRPDQLALAGCGPRDAKQSFEWAVAWTTKYNIPLDYARYFCDTALAQQPDMRAVLNGEWNGDLAPDAGTHALSMEFHAADTAAPSLQSPRGMTHPAIEYSPGPSVLRRARMTDAPGHGHDTAPSPSDASIIARVLDGDATAFDQLVRRHYAAEGPGVRPPSPVSANGARPLCGRDAGG